MTIVLFVFLEKLWYAQLKRKRCDFDLNVTEELWGNIPLLHIVEEEFNDKQVACRHFPSRFTSAKEHNLHYAYNMAKKGYPCFIA